MSTREDDLNELERLSREVLQLRADLARVTAERDEARKREQQNLQDARDLDGQYTSSMRKLIACERELAKTKAALKDAKGLLRECQPWMPASRTCDASRKIDAFVRIPAPATGKEGA